MKDRLRSDFLTSWSTRGIIFHWIASGVRAILCSLKMTIGVCFDSTHAGTLHEDGTGSWMYAIDCTGCGNGGSSPQLPGPLDFTILGESAADFIENGKLFVAASDICFVATGVEPPATVAEPPALAQLSAGLMALCMIWWWGRSPPKRRLARNNRVAS